MTSHAKSRKQSLILAGIVALFILLLLLRLFVFAHGHTRRGFHSANATGAVQAASYKTEPPWARRPWTDRFNDGTPDFLRLTDPADQAAFRQWFITIADFQAIRPRADVPPEITDCASLLRYSYREALKRHDDLAPIKGPVHVGDIVAVRLAVNGTDWKYLLAEDPIPAGTEFLANTGLYTPNNKPDWWADWFTRKEFHDDRAAFFNTNFSGRREYVYLLKVVDPGNFVISPAQVGPMHQSNVQATSDPATLEVQQ